MQTRPRVRTDEHVCKLPQGLRKLERVSSLDNFMSSKQLDAKLGHVAARARPSSPSQN